MTTTSPSALRVGVIGAGAAGLAVARVLTRSGVESVTVLERDGAPGGVWRYDGDKSKSDNTECRPMYRGLRTNLPRQVMQYREKPWPNPTNEPRSYVTHEEVRDYLAEYADDYELQRHVRYGCTVTQLTMHDDGVSLKWDDVNNDNGDKQQQQQNFDMVCVCNGHYAAPALPDDVAGLNEHFTGTILHSAAYDDPQDFKGKTVLCVGGRASGSDLAREISEAGATHVYLSDSTCVAATTQGGVTHVPRTTHVDEHGAVHFGNDDDDDEAAHVDVVIFCTGYDYAFPFCNAASRLGSDFAVVPGERRVSPLYEQLWHARHPDKLAFIGLPHSVVPFPLFELQAEAVARRLLEGEDVLPPLEARLAAARRDRDAGGPDPDKRRVQQTHFLGGHQWDYCRRLAQLAGKEEDVTLENYLRTNQAIYDHAGGQRKNLFPGGPDTYRETCYERDDDRQSFKVVYTEIEVKAPTA